MLTRQQLYVAVSDDDTIQVIDRDTLTVVKTLPSGDDPETFVVNSKGNLMYVSNEDDNLVTVIDLEKAEAIKTIQVGVEPEGIAVSADNKWVASASETTNMVHWIETSTHTIVHNTLVDTRPRALQFTADSQELWVSSEIGGSVSVFDVASKQLKHKLTFKIPGVTRETIQPVGIVIDAQRRWAYVALGPANRVAVIDAKSYEIKDYLLVGQRVWNLAFSPDNKRLIYD